MAQEIQNLLLELNLVLSPIEQSIASEVLVTKELAKNLESIRRY